MTTRRKPVPRHPAGGGFAAIDYPADRLVPCAADPEPFAAAQAELEARDWLGHTAGIDAICEYCHGCPVADQCAAAAAAERWTGIAGGHIWRDGERRT